MKNPLSALLIVVLAAVSTGCSVVDLTLKPVALRSAATVNSSYPFDCNLQLDTLGGASLSDGVGEGQIVAGYERGVQSCTFSTAKAVDYDRGGVKFDISSIPKSANLGVMDLTFDLIDDQHSIPCGFSIQLATVDWAAFGDTATADDFTAVPLAELNWTETGGPSVEPHGANVNFFFDDVKKIFSFVVDVKPAFNQWKIGKPNFGLVFLSSVEDESLDFGDSADCSEMWGNFQLHVVFSK